MVACLNASLMVLTPYADFRRSAVMASTRSAKVYSAAFAAGNIPLLVQLTDFCSHQRTISCCLFSVGTSCVFYSSAGILPLLIFLRKDADAVCHWIAEHFSPLPAASAWLLRFFQQSSTRSLPRPKRRPAAPVRQPGSLPTQRSRRPWSSRLRRWPASPFLQKTSP